MEVIDAHLDITPSDDLYWLDSSTLWPHFLANRAFDHAYFIEIFKTVVADSKYRKLILQKVLHDPHLLYADCHTGLTLDSILQQLRRFITKCQSHNRLGFFSWCYPPYCDKGNFVTHYIMLLIDIMTQTVYVFDSRGLEYAKKHWNTAHRKLCTVFRENELNIQYVNYFDIQSLCPYDEFCQTWSLLLLFDFISQHAVYLRRRLGVSDKAPVHVLIRSTMHYYSPTNLIDFYRTLITTMPAIREACYYQIYRQTHSMKGQRKYHRYFTTLEALVFQSNCTFYKPNASYDAQGLTFLEDFFTYIQEKTWVEILHSI